MIGAFEYVPAPLLASYALLLVAGTWLDRATGSQSTSGRLRRITDLPCPLCRGSRAAEALAQGDLPGAVFWNPLATTLLIGTGAWFIVRFGFARRLEPRLTRTGRRASWATAVAVVLANWACVIAMGDRRATAHCMDRRRLLATCCHKFGISSRGAGQV